MYGANVEWAAIVLYKINRCAVFASQIQDVEMYFAESTAEWWDGTTRGGIRSVMHSRN